METTDWSKPREGEQISSRCITSTEQTTTNRTSREQRNRFYSFARVNMVAEDQFRQNMEEFNPMAALLGMDVTLRREVHQERARINELNINITKTSSPSKSKLMRNTKKSSTFERLWKLWRTKTKKNLRGVDVQKRRDQSPQSQTRSA